MKSNERIHIVNGYERNAYTYIPVVIVGAGESGIGMGCQLKQQLGFDQFRIFDRQAGLGGTWWINRYPGVACDVPCPFYSFSWRPNLEATELYPTGPELIGYFQTVASEYGIIDKISLNTDVKEIRWLEKEKEWEIKLEYLAYGMGDLAKHERERIAKEKGHNTVYIGTDTVRAKIAISACGGLVEPNQLPSTIPGWEEFKGDVMHTARWSRDVDFTGKDVVVVGSGCSAAQTVPNLVHAPYNAKSVTQIMRTAPWVEAKVEEPGGKKSYKETAPFLYKNVPFMNKLVRLSIALEAERTWFSLFGTGESHAKNRKATEDRLLRRMKRLAPAKYHEMLTPNFSVGCKRRIFDQAWYKGLNDPRIHLTTQKLVAVGEDSVTLDAGGSFPDREDDPSAQTSVTVHADAIIMANGFNVTQWLHPLEIIGRGGRPIHDVWHERGGAQAYMGNAMDGFPNFFIIFGPNTATGHTSVIFTSENMINFTIRMVRRILSGEAETIEVKESAEVEYTTTLQRDLKNTVFYKGGCFSWYYDAASGWNSTMYPRNQWEFWLRCTFPQWSHWHVTLTRRGLLMHRVRLLLRSLAFFALVLGYRRLSRAGVSLKALPDLLKMSAKMGSVALLAQIGSLAERLQERVLS